MKEFFVIISLIVFISCAKEEEEPFFQFNPQEDSMAWNSKSLPIPLKISKNFSDSECQDILDVAQKWEDAAGCKLINYEGKKDEPILNNLSDYFHYDADNGVYKPEHKVLGLDRGILAVCQCYIEYSHSLDDGNFYQIKHADIIFNDYHYEFNDGGGSGMYDLYSLLVHEFGHFFGLLHNEQGVMDGGGMSSLDLEREIDEQAKAEIYDKYHIWSPNQIDRSPASLNQAASIPSSKGIKVIMYKMEDGKIHYEIQK